MSPCLCLYNFNIHIQKKQTFHLMGLSMTFIMKRTLGLILTLPLDFPDPPPGGSEDDFELRK